MITSQTIKKNSKNNIYTQTTERKKRPESTRLKES
jgi:hypothetical protein